MSAHRKWFWKFLLPLCMRVRPNPAKDWSICSVTRFVRRIEFCLIRLMEGGRGRGGMLALLLVQACSEYYRLQRKPPVTAALMAANTLIYLRPTFLKPYIPTINRVLFNPHLILKHKDLKRFILSAFYHTGEPHLVYNMLSLLWKGIQLESAMGSTEFASMVASLVVMSQGFTLLLAKGLLLFDYDTAYYDEYSVGFSGVLFAMKVVLYSQSDHYTSVQGLLVPARYAAWAELILIQMFVPGVSFLGHLGGILAGLFYIYVKTSQSGADPIVKITKGLISLLRWPFRIAYGMFRPSRGRRVFGRGNLGRSEEGNVNVVWRCGACTYDNSDRWSACQMCGMDRGSSNEFSYSDQRSGSGSEGMPLAELRRLRLQRFGR